LLKPLESSLDFVIPEMIFVHTFFCVREAWDVETFFIPVYTTTAAFSSAWLVARADTNASIEIPVGKSCVWSWELLIAVEGSTVVGNDAADLIGSPVTEESSASLLKKVSMTRVETDTADFSSARAF